MLKSEVEHEKLIRANERLSFVLEVEAFANRYTKYDEEYSDKYK